MANRSSFDKSLSELREDIKYMAGMAREALSSSVASLKQQDMALADKVIQNDIAINEFEEKINDKAILLIAKEQPLATDLRKIIVSLKISSDIERIADFAVNVSKATKRIGNAQLVKPIIHIPQMADLVNRMLTEAIDAYKYEDAKLAVDSSKIDDQVDALYRESIDELINIATQDSTNMEQIMQLAMICRYLERSGDHVTNISENTIYMVKGIKTDLNT